MKIKRNHFALMSVFGALASAGAAVAHAVEGAIEFVEGKLHLLHVETAQHCQFDDQGAVDDFLANIPDPQNWVDPLAQPALLGATRVEVDLGQLREALDADAAAAPVIEQAPAQPDAAVEQATEPAAQ
jgi:hypothetical protein